MDIPFPLQFISTDKSVDHFIAFSQKDNDDHFLDDYPRTLKTDVEVKEYMSKLGATSSRMQQMDREQRNGVLKKLRKLDGVSIRQISRVTGVSKSVIDRLR